ncbi:MAG: hypothetical protein GYA51_18980, partial [Candidatus Methanofastidiosa archaeon]|nr:hypothetical protein [Candidatus Methanofastidiosa archaeon]
MYGSVDFILKNIYGHYYFLLLEKRNGRIFMGNSFFSILPVYYCQIKDKIVISESALRLGRQTGKQKISKRYVLESLLFNYPLFNSTIFEEIQLLPVNTNLMISGDKVYLQKHTKIEDYFIRKPFSRKRSIRIITDKFIETVNKYFPSEHFMCTLTGGFDGRTITSAGKYLNKPFSTYSFGEESSKDIQIAQEVAQVAGIRYFKIPLDYSYIEKHSINNGREFIINSSGLATFTRAHYLYATKILSEKTKYILTGNFGSEIFRAVHIPGVFISANLYNLFATEKPDEGIKKIETSSEFRYLPLQIFREDWEALKCDLVNLPCYKNQLPGFSRNEKFYVFVFEEVFRKYFGAELVNQFYYLKNRTPFLDIDFLSAILSTRYAGVYSRYFEHNPLNRYKGQVLYASIINNTFPLLGDIKTDKGYKPNDLMSLFGKAA